MTFVLLSFLITPAFSFTRDACFPWCLVFLFWRCFVPTELKQVVELKRRLEAREQVQKSRVHLWYRSPFLTKSLQELQRARAAAKEGDSGHCRCRGSAR